MIQHSLFCCTRSPARRPLCSTEANVGRLPPCYVMSSVPTVVDTGAGTLTLVRVAELRSFAHVVFLLGILPDASLAAKGP